MARTEEEVAFPFPHFPSSGAHPDRSEVPLGRSEGKRGAAYHESVEDARRMPLPATSSARPDSPRHIPTLRSRWKIGRTGIRNRTPSEYVSITANDSNTSMDQSTTNPGQPHVQGTPASTNRA